MKKPGKFLLLLIAYAFLVEGVFAGNNCLEDTICIETARDKGFVDFYVKNLKAFDATVTVTLNGTNLKSPGSLPYKETVSGNSRIKMFRLSIINKKSKWHYKYHVDWTRGSMYARHDNSYIYRLPYEKGTIHEVSQACKGKFSHSDRPEYAVDFLMPEGTPVYASRDGIVVGIRDKNDTGGPSRDFEKFANYVIIRHQDRTIGEYMHLKKDGAAVKTGDSVKRGQLIGYSGNTGFSSEPHLHFGVYKSYDGKKRISFPVKFRSPKGVISCPVKGESYMAE